MNFLSHGLTRAKNYANRRMLVKRFSAFLLSIVLVTYLMISHLALADAGPIPGVDSVTNWLTQPAPVIVMIGALVMGLLMRLWPTSKAAGWPHIIAAGAQQLANLLAAFAKWTDTVLPQNTIPPV